MEVKLAHSELKTSLSLVFLIHDELIIAAKSNGGNSKYKSYFYPRTKYLW